MGVRILLGAQNLIFNPKCKIIHTATNLGGNISPENKKKWACFYHRNTSYFFFKHLYNKNPIKLISFLLREFIMSIFRSIIYKNPYYFSELKIIKKGKKLLKEKK